MINVWAVLLAPQLLTSPLQANPRYDFTPRRTRDELLMNVRPGFNKETFKEIHLDLVDLGDLDGPDSKELDNRADRELAALKQLRQAALPLQEQGAVLALRRGSELLVFPASLTPGSQVSLISIRRPDQPARTLRLGDRLAAKLRNFLPHDGPENIRGAHAALRQAFDGASLEAAPEPFSAAIGFSRSSDRVAADEELRQIVDNFTADVAKDFKWRGSALTGSQLATLVRYSLDQSLEQMTPSLGKISEQEWMRRWGLRFRQTWYKAPSGLLHDEGLQITRASRRWNAVRQPLVDGKQGVALRASLRSWIKKHLFASEDFPTAVPLDWSAVRAGARDERRAAEAQALLKPAPLTETPQAQRELRDLAREFASPMAQLMPDASGEYPFREFVNVEIFEELLHSALRNTLRQTRSSPAFKGYSSEEQKSSVGRTFSGAWYDSAALMADQVLDKTATAIPQPLRQIFIEAQPTERARAAQNYLRELAYDWPEAHRRVLDNALTRQLTDRFIDWMRRYDAAK